MVELPLSKPNTMKNTLRDNLEQICHEFTEAYECLLGSDTIGTCYLIGHCLSEGFKRAGYKALEETGTVIYKDGLGKNVIYGKQLVKGRLIGYFHTWCKVQFGEKEIIIDPSYKYNKMSYKHYGFKPNKRIPDFIITEHNDCWLYRFIQDNSLTSQSKQWLTRIPSELIEELIQKVQDSVEKWIGCPNILLFD